MLKEENIALQNMPETSFDSPLGLGSSAGLIFGNSGGVCEAALRTAYYFMMHENLEKDALKFQEVRGFQGVKAVSYTHLKIINGLKVSLQSVKEEDIPLLEKWKLQTVFDYAGKLSIEEQEKIRNYVHNEVDVYKRQT